MERVSKFSFNTVFNTGVVLIVVLLWFTIPARSQVYVGGELTGDETYSPENNPYIVIQDLTVGRDVKLTILPGVEMQFEYGTSLISYGTLIAKGTEAQKIRFYSRNQTSVPGQWNGITLYGTKTLLGADSAYVMGSVLSDVSISDATYSVTLADNTSLLVENSSIAFCSFGININNSAYNVIRNCNFTMCDFGIFLAAGFQNPGNKIYSNTIAECSDVGIFINSYASESSYNSIWDNTINSCSIGIHIGNYGNNGPGYNTVSGNYFIGNKEAVKLFQHSTTLRNNYFSKNRNAIICWQSNNNTITQNLFSRSLIQAVTLAAGSSYNNITYNSITFNNGGISVQPDSTRNSVFNSFLYNTAYTNSTFSFRISSAPQGPVQFNNLMQNGDSGSFKNLSDKVIHAEYNYWGTKSFSGIDSIIFDVYDASGLGEVLYKPILENILSIAPVPPPAKVIKQLVGTDVVLSWEARAITDLEGYNVYFGANDGITFAHTFNNGLKTSVNMGSFPIGDTIAVTAFDFMANGLYDQTEGHESDYSYAITAPYAGPDTAICYNNAYAIAKSTAVDFEVLTWSTSGDGSFDNTHILHPVYSPGPLDYFNGYVNLFLEAQNSELQYKDVARITFQDAPLVFAGNDTIISIDSVLRLDNANATGYDYLKWNSAGDGTFTSDTLLNPAYQPGPGDIANGNVILTFTGFSECGSVSDQLFLKIDPGYSISGRIHAGEILADNSNLSVYSTNGTSIKPVRSGHLSTDGSFEIKALFAGTYYLYVIPDKVNNPAYIPTYFFNDIRWGNAHKIELTDNTYDVDIDLARITVQLPEGEGSVLGYCSTMAGSSERCNDVTVLLYDKLMKNILGWAVVRDGSDFRFRNLPFGEYVLSGEKAGTLPFHSDLIVVSPSQPKIENVELVCSAAGYKFNMANSSSNETGPASITVFPNPASDRLYFSGLTENANYLIQLINAQGIIQNFYTESYNGEVKTLDISELHAGIYFVQICTNGDCFSQTKIIKY